LTQIDPAEIGCLGISGHSLGVVPLDKEGRLLRDTTPIWSDSRAQAQASELFMRVPEDDWYLLTGNGFPAPLYSVFKIMWYRDTEPDLFNRTAKVIGTKDYLNYRLTGRIATDFSYASGSGVYDLLNWKYSAPLISASLLPEEIFPEILPSTEVIGTLTPGAAAALGLHPRVQVVAGGVDNSCMALGARNIKEGSVYNSQGSSSWIAVTSSKPIFEKRFRPFIFAHVMPGLFNSAIPVFSSGSSFRWLRDTLCPDLVEQAKREGKDVYALMTAIAAQSKPGARGLLFSPNLAGGSSIDESIHIRGAFIGLDLSHTRAEVIRSVMEGIALEMRLALEPLRALLAISDEMIVVGGGSRSKLWRQIYADVYKMRVVKTNIDQQAAALGAAAIAAVGTGIWKDFQIVDQIHQVIEAVDPLAENVEIYDRLMPVFKKASHYLADLGDDVASLG
ncbi:MAG: pentose kinase, partial [Anaerolineaceae bacterium]|nr:pentose kinase [Anaerolineaceae bacterium]